MNNISNNNDNHTQILSILAKYMIELINPKIGQTFYDQCCGSGNIIIESYKYLHNYVSNSEDMDQLKNNTFYGNEINNDAYTSCQKKLKIYSINKNGRRVGTEIRSLYTCRHKKEERYACQYQCLYPQTRFGGYVSGNCIDAQLCRY